MLVKDNSFVENCVKNLIKNMNINLIKKYIK